MSITFFRGREIKESPYYEAITVGQGALHQCGALFRLLSSPESYPPSIIAVATHENIPYSVVSITSNSVDNKRLMCNQSSTNELSIVFPNFEIMAFTEFFCRNKGLTKQLISALLKEANIQPQDQIYVYSKRMERIIRSLNYKVDNLHDYTP